MTKKKEQSPIIEHLNIMTVAVEISGTAPLIQNNFSQKAIEELLRKHMGLSNPKEKKVPAECLERAIVRNTKDVICMPSTCFKNAMVGASSTIKGLKKTNLRIQIFVEGQSIPITYSRMVPRMDIVKLAGIGRVPDIRFRPEFDDWKARMIISFSDDLPVQTVLDLLVRAGSGGVGEWRPQRSGSFGTFEVSRNITAPEEIKEVRSICRYPVKPIIIPDWAMNAELTPEILKHIAHGNMVEEVAEEEAVS